MDPVPEGSSDYQEAFYAVSGAYIGSAENVASCNVRLNEGKELQRKLKATYEKSQPQNL